MDILLAESPQQVEVARNLFLEYEKALGISLCFQGFEQELANLPGCYLPPLGRLLLGFEEGFPVACGGLRPLAAGTCEIKRMYVRPGYRGQGYGRRMCESLLVAARSEGYEKVRLDSLGHMHEAISLYRSLGFEEIHELTSHPGLDVHFMELVL